eukprot:gene9428-biopygen5489
MPCGSGHGVCSIAAGTTVDDLLAHPLDEVLQEYPKMSAVKAVDCKRGLWGHVATHTPYHCALIGNAEALRTDWSPSAPPALRGALAGLGPWRDNIGGG